MDKKKYATKKQSKYETDFEGTFKYLINGFGDNGSQTGKLKETLSEETQMTKCNWNDMQSQFQTNCCSKFLW